jgi:hypothetical protein
MRGLPDVGDVLMPSGTYRGVEWILSTETSVVLWLGLP